MIKIAICDDDKIHVDKLQNEAERVCDKHNIQVEIKKYTSVIKMLKDNKKVLFDIVLLDIEMPEMNGFDAAKILSKENESVFLVFVTNRDELVYESLKYHPFYFVRKKHLNELEEQIIEINKIIKRESVRINIETPNGDFIINPQKILYVESEKNYVNLVFSDSEKLLVRKTMSNIEKEWEKYNFIRVHSGYIVNLKYITKYKENNIILKDKINIPVSRGKSKFVKNKIMEALLKDDG